MLTIKNTEIKYSESFLHSFDKLMMKERNRLTNGYEFKLSQLSDEVEKLKLQYSSLLRVNEGLEKKIKTNNKTPLIETSNKIIDDANTSFDLVFNMRSSREWHCSTPRENSFDKFENYIIVENPVEVSCVIVRLMNLCNRYEREISVYDKSLDRWAKQIIVGTAPADALGGYPELFACPKGGRCTLDFIDKILEKTKPFELKNIPIPEQKYPKARVIS